MDYVSIGLVVSLVINVVFWLECRHRGSMIEEQQELIDEYRKATVAVGKVARS